MGEIAEALRRAREARRERPSSPSSGPSATVLETTPPIETVRVSHEPAAVEADRRESRMEEAWDADVQRCQLPVAGEHGSPGRTLLVPAEGTAAECFRRFAIRVRSALEHRSVNSVLITSGIHAEGKTFTSSNLAVALCSIAAGRRVALVEFDLRKPTICKGLGIEPAGGIERVLSKGAPLESACVRIESVQLDLYPVREPATNAHELFSGSFLVRTVRELERRYDLVVFDTAPVLLLPDVPLIAPYIGASVFVVRMGWTRLVTLREVFKASSDENRIGVFLNDAPASRHSAYYGYYAQKDDSE